MRAKAKDRETPEGGSREEAASRAGLAWLGDALLGAVVGIVAATVLLVPAMVIAKLLVPILRPEDLAGHFCGIHWSTAPCEWNLQKAAIMPGGGSPRLGIFFHVYPLLLAAAYPPFSSIRRRVSATFAR